MSICKRVRAYLEANGISQKEAAEKANIPYPAFNSMMNERREMFPNELRAICLALNVKPEVFM